jgi:predicted membrane protein
MEQNDMDNMRKNSRIWTGVALLCAGILLWSYKMGAPIPGWVFTWPVLLIALGILIGIKSRFHNPGALILILIGGVFLIDKTSPGLNFHDYIFPALLIGMGLIYILRPRPKWRDRMRHRWEYRDRNNPSLPESNFRGENFPVTEDTSEFIDISSVLGGVKKLILSKNFKGGEVSNFMGGTELNLMQADIQQPITLEINNIFGGTKLIVPANWDVKIQVSTIFGGVDDKRNLNTGIPDSNKIMTLKGTCIFGGVEVSNF